jgi:hypothetical protein
MVAIFGNAHSPNLPEQLPVELCSELCSRLGFRRFVLHLDRSSYLQDGQVSDMVHHTICHGLLMYVLTSYFC